MLRARTSGEAIERFSVLERVGDGRGVVPISLSQPKAITHAASLGIAGLSDPNNQTAGPLLQMASLNAWVPGNANNFDLASPMQTWSVMPEMRELARLHQGELLVALGDPIGVHSTGVVSMLGLGPGDQVVVNALLDTPTANRMSSRALIILLSQNEAARDMVVEAMSDANPARRRAAMEAAFRLLREDERGVVRPAIAARLRDPDPIVAFQAAEALWFSNPSGQEVAAIFDALATAVVVDPALVSRAAELLQTNFESFGEVRQLKLLAMSRSEAPGAKEFFVAVVLGNANEVDSLMGARAMALIEAGVPAPTNVPAWQLESLRARFGPGEPEPAP